MIRIDGELASMLEADGFDVRENYSGKFMYGAECFGIVARSWFPIAEILREYAANLPLLDDGVTDADPMLKFSIEVLNTTEPEQDNMALNMIYYWPGIGTPATSDSTPPDWIPFPS